MGATARNHGEGAALGQSRMRRRLLDSLPTSARTTGAEAAARSRLVRRLRIALPAAAVVLVAAFILNTRSNTVDPAFLDDFEDLSASAEELRVASPRFTGVDNQGKPFEITARSATQRPGGPDVVELDMPRAVQGENDQKTVVTAKRGLYRSENNVLELQDGVALEHKIGAETYVLRAPAATVAIKDEVVSSDAGIGGEGQDGSKLNADRMTAYRAEGRVVFEGGVSMRLYPNSAITGAGNDVTPAEPEDNNNGDPQ